MVRKKLATLLAMALLLGAASSARADLEIALSEDGGPAFKVVAKGASFSSASFTGVFGDFSVVLFGGSSDNGATLSDVLSADVKIANLDATKSHTLHMWVSQDGFSLPAGSPLIAESSMGGTVNSGTLGLKNIFQAYADKGDKLFVTTDYTNGPQSATAAGSSFDTGSASGLFNRIGTYSGTIVANLDTGAGGTNNYSAHLNFTPVPAPAGVVLALAGLPCLGIGQWLRRRSKTA